MFPAEIIREIGHWLSIKDRLGLFSTCRNYWRSHYNWKPLNNTHLLRGHYQYNDTFLKLHQQLDRRLIIHAPHLTRLTIKGNFGAGFRIPNLSNLEYLAIEICWYSRSFQPRALVQQLEQLAPRAQLLLDIHPDKCLPHERIDHHQKIEQLIRLMSTHPRFDWYGPTNLGYIWRSVVDSMVRLADFDIYKRRMKPVLEYLSWNRYLGRVIDPSEIPPSMDELASKISHPQHRQVFLVMVDEPSPLMKYYSEHSYSVWISPYLCNMLLVMPEAWSFYSDDPVFCRQLRWLDPIGLNSKQKLARNAII